MNSPLKNFDSAGMTVEGEALTGTLGRLSMDKAR